MIGEGWGERIKCMLQLWDAEQPKIAGSIQQIRQHLNCPALIQVGNAGYLKHWTPRKAIWLGRKLGFVPWAYFGLHWKKWRRLNFKVTCHFNFYSHLSAFDFLYHFNGAQRIIAQWNSSSILTYNNGQGSTVNSRISDILPILFIWKLTSSDAKSPTLA